MVRMDFSNRPAKKAPDTLLADTGLEGALAALLAGVQPASRRIYTSHARAFARWLAQEGLTARDATDEAALGRYRETLYQEKAEATARVAYSVVSALMVILKEEEEQKKEH